jgi:hypothetical protein
MRCPTIVMATFCTSQIHEFTLKDNSWISDKMLQLNIFSLRIICLCLITLTWFSIMLGLVSIYLSKAIINFILNRHYNLLVNTKCCANQWCWSPQLNKWQQLQHCKIYQKAVVTTVVTTVVTNVFSVTNKK